MKTLTTILLLLALVIPVTGCKHEDAQDHAIDYWTCSMHPQIHQDEPGNCPICGMKLVPVYKKATEAPVNGAQGASSENDMGAAPTASVQISAERQQHIGVKTAVVASKTLTKTIRTYGRVAFDPELAVAQKDYLEVLKNAPSLKAASRSRLMVLGMSESEIKNLETKGGVSSEYYLPGKTDSIWIYATIYEDDLLLVKPGMAAHINHSFEAEKSCEGIVRGIDPIVDPRTRAVRARIEVITPNVHLRPNSYVDVELKAELGEHIAIPKSAILDTGTRRIAFVVQGDHFSPRMLTTSDATEDDVVVVSGLAVGETIVTSATFLVDAESQLRGVVGGAL